MTEGEQTGTERTDPEQAEGGDGRHVPSRRPTYLVAGLALLALAGVLLVVLSAHVTPAGTRSVSGSDRVETIAPAPPQPSNPPASSAPPAQKQHKPTGNLFAAAIVVVGLLCVVAAIVMIVGLLRGMVRHRGLRRRPKLAPAGPEPSAVVVAQRVESAVDRALAELDLGGPVSDAIVRCWVQLEHATTAAGVVRDVTDTPEQAIGRVFAAGEVRAEPLHVLADLYREARFSRHPMSADEATAARAALTEIVDELRARTGRGTDDYQ